MKTKRVLVTGATGFLARHLIPALQSGGAWSVVGIARSHHAPPWLDQDAYHSVSAADLGQMDRLIAKVAPSAVVHLAAQVRGTASELCQNNVVTVANLLAITHRRLPSCRMILLGSAAEYGSGAQSAMPITEATTCTPEGAYGVTKLAASELALQASRSWQARVSVVRPFNIVGAGMPTYLVGGALIERMHAAIRHGGGTPVRIGRIDTERDFIAVQDVVGALLRLLEIDEGGEIYNLCSGRPTPIGELMQMLLRLSGRDLNWQIDPSLVRVDDVAASYGSNAKARARFGFTANAPLADAMLAAWHASMHEHDA